MRLAIRPVFASEAVDKMIYLDQDEISKSGRSRAKRMVSLGNSALEITNF
jgi:hypothetical protein